MTVCIPLRIEGNPDTHGFGSVGGQNHVGKGEGLMEDPAKMFKVP